MKINTLIITLAIGLQSMVGFSQDYYLHCGSILDVQTGKEIKMATIVVSKNKITKISDGFVAKSNANDIEVNLKNKFILPGLIDLHVHLESEQNPKSYASKYTNNDREYSEFLFNFCFNSG